MPKREQHALDNFSAEEVRGLLRYAEMRAKKKAVLEYRKKYGNLVGFKYVNKFTGYAIAKEIKRNPKRVNGVIAKTERSAKISYEVFKRISKYIYLLRDNKLKQALNIESPVEAYEERQSLKKQKGTIINNR